MEHLGRKQQSRLAQLPRSGLSVWCIENPDSNPSFHGTDVLTGKELRKEAATDGVGRPGSDPSCGQLVSRGETSEPEPC